MARLCATCGRKLPFSLRKNFKKLQENFYCTDCFPRARREYLKNMKPFIDEKLSSIYRDLDKFFSAGVLKVIYAGQYFCICNVSNWCYAVFDYNFYKNADFDAPLAYVLHAKYIEAVMENDDLFYKWVKRIPTQELPNNVIHCTDKIFEVMKEKKEETDANGPKVALDDEQELIEKYSILRYN